MQCPPAQPAASNGADLHPGSDVAADGRAEPIMGLLVHAVHPHREPAHGTGERRADVHACKQACRTCMQHAV